MKRKQTLPLLSALLLVPVVAIAATNRTGVFFRTTDAGLQQLDDAAGLAPWTQAVTLQVGEVRRQLAAKPNESWRLDSSTPMLFRAVPSGVPYQGHERMP